MKAYILRTLRRVLPRYRRTPIVRFVRRAAQITFRLIENDNYDIRENGEGRVLELISKHLEVATVFDVGANIGEYAAAALAAFPVATIHAFEPVGQTYAILAPRFAGATRVHTYNYGLSDKSASVEFSVRPDDLSNSTSHPDASHLLNPGVERMAVRCELRRSGTAAEEIGVSTIDVLKIDTEGNDWFILDGFCEWLHAGRIKVIQFEYGMTCIFTKKLLADHYTILRQNGYIVGKIYPTYVDFRPYDPMDEDFIGPNYLAVHESTGLEKVL
jgi:FkbM family methyltransferase